MPLCSFGFDAFHQTSRLDSITTKPNYQHSNVKKVLLASWESTFILTDKNTIEVWGYCSESIKRHLEAWRDLNIQSMFGDPNTCLGAVDRQGRVWYGDSAAVPLATDAKDAVYCQSLDTVYVLKESGKVECFHRSSTTSIMLDLPAVFQLAASYSHVLFYTVESASPIYVLGSNRFSQTGLDFRTQQDITNPEPIEFFDGLRQVCHESIGANIACGPFHSAVIIAGDVYTFGWRKDGRLGWSPAEEDATIALPIFLDNTNKPVDITAQSVACGYGHTVVIDNSGAVWTCGSNKYNQLGRQTLREYDETFRQCNLGDVVAVQCHASRWGSFIQTKYSMKRS